MRFGMAAWFPVIAVAAVVWATGPSWAEGGGGVCDARDQLECSCKAAGQSYPNFTVRPCLPGALQVLTLNQSDELAANAFAAVNWPGSAVRGVPDFTAMTAGAPVPEDHAPVWQGWRATSDIFRDDGQPPLDWDAPGQVLPAACDGVALTPELRGAFAWARVPESPYPPRLLQQMINPQDQMLIDRSGQPVRYEVVFNRQAHDYVVGNHLWTVDGLAAEVANGNLSFPPGDRSPETRGAMLVKAAWKILDPATDDPGHFHKAWAYVTPLVEAGQERSGCALLPVGLVGLHVTMKLSDDDGWLWGTVEHRALAPMRGEDESLFQSEPPAYRTSETRSNDATDDWIFYSPPGCAGGLCSGQIGLDKPTLPAKDGGGPIAFSPAPSRITQWSAPGAYYSGGTGGTDAECGERSAYRAGPDSTSASLDFACINRRLWAGFEGSVLSFYQLKGSQWNRHGTPVPDTLANAAIESFNQGTSSCQSCHRGAGQPPSGNAGYGTNLASQFDHVFAFMHILGMTANGTLP